MGQKINPVSFRTGVVKDWKSRWFSGGALYKKFLFEDLAIRELLGQRLKLAGVHEIEIERLPGNVNIRVYVSRPGVVIGRGGAGIEVLKSSIQEKIGPGYKGKPLPKINIDVEEIKNSELSAKLVAQRIAAEFERRLPHRRVVNKAIDRIMAAGAKGVKVALAGRIEGAEIARREKYMRGSIPSQTLRADIDYAQDCALLKRGYVGIKVWIYRGKERGYAAA